MPSFRTFAALCAVFFIPTLVAPAARAQSSPPSTSFDMSFNATASGTFGSDVITIQGSGTVTDFGAATLYVFIDSGAAGLITVNIENGPIRGSAQRPRTSARDRR
jgi:hypothetical protein